MIAPFDIMRVEADGSFRWLEAVQDLDTAKARVQALGVSAPGRYIIFSQVTGNKISIDVDPGGVLSTSA
jgi:hypothetical protein